jgi:hypothetical protein
MVLARFGWSVAHGPPWAHRPTTGPAIGPGDRAGLRLPLRSGHGPGGASLSGVMAPLDVDVGNMASKTSSFKAAERPDALKQASGRSCQFARVEAVLANRRSLAYQVTYADCSYLLKRRMRNVRRFLGVPPLGV